MMSFTYHILPNGDFWEDVEDGLKGFEDLRKLTFLCGEEWNNLGVHKHFVRLRDHPPDCTACILIAFSKKRESND